MAFLVAYAKNGFCVHMLRTETPLVRFRGTGGGEFVLIAYYTP